MTNRFSDADFAAEVRARLASGHTRLLVIANNFRASLHTALPDDEWLIVGSGEIGSEMEDLLGAAAKRRALFWQSTSMSDVESTPLDAGSAQVFLKNGLRAWAKGRDKVTKLSGRSGEVDEKTRFRVASEAAWRCQMDGCGVSLRDHFVPGAEGNNYGYFAHIVASSEDGPRGDKELSPKLANNPGNILLLCDKCHRLIDRVDPEWYTAERLSRMRERSVVEVKRLLDTLTYQESQILVIQGSIQGQVPAFDQRQAEASMWRQRLRPGSRPPEWFGNNGKHMSDPHHAAYWASMFTLLRDDLPRLRSMLTGASLGGGPLPPLSIFPAHTTSMTILSGRIVGDATSCRLFQFHRNQTADGDGGGPWAWPEGPQPSHDKFSVLRRKEHEAGDEEALLQLSLTAAIPSSELPDHLYSDGEYTIPAIELRIANCSHSCISHPLDLELLGKALDEALAVLQDEWRVKRIHFVPIAPLTANFRAGQKMQARNQAEFVLYEKRNIDGKLPEFKPTILISGSYVAIAESPLQRIELA